MSSFFTIPYIAFLGFILLLISGVYIFLVKRMANQNHQFCSIVGVVTSLADELNRLKEFISTTLIQKSNDSSKEIQLTKNDLIHVSDDEEEEDSDDEEDTDEESDEEEEEEDNKYELSNEIASNLEIDTPDEIKYIQITPTIKEEELIKVSEKEEINLETITEEQPITEEFTTEEFTTEEIKDISESDEVVDYKKLPLNKLRSLIVEKGLAEDASKLKKPVLLQMLEQIN